MLERLRPGIKSDALNGSMEAIGLFAPADLCDLYEWRNGTDTQGAKLDDIHLWPGFYFLTIKDAIANYGAFVADSRWDRAWIPVFANGGGDFYAVICETGRSELGRDSPFSRR